MIGAIASQSPYPAYPVQPVSAPVAAARQASDTGTDARGEETARQAAAAETQARPASDGSAAKPVDDGTYRPVPAALLDQAALTPARQTPEAAEPAATEAGETETGVAMRGDVGELDVERSRRRDQAAADKPVDARSAVVETASANAKPTEVALAAAAPAGEPVPVKSYMEF